MGYTYFDELYLAHHGVKGMKWGVRRYRNPDGSLTKRGKKHKQAALNTLQKRRQETAEEVKMFKEYTETNRKALKESQAHDKKVGVTTWQTHALKDAYIATGREYVEAKYRLALYDRDIKAYKNDEIKVGEDYVMRGFGKTKVKHTPSGNDKENRIVDEVTKDALKRYAKELKEYS